MIRRMAMIAPLWFAAACGPSSPLTSESWTHSDSDVLVAAFGSVAEKSPEIEKLLDQATYRLTPTDAPNQSIYRWLFDEGYLDDLGAPRELLVALDSVSNEAPGAIDPVVFSRVGVEPYLGPESDQLIDLGYQFGLASDSTRVILVSLGAPLIRNDQALVDFNYRCDRVECWERGLVFLRYVGDEWVPVGRVTYVFS